jgi:rubredoxin
MGIIELDPILAQKAIEGYVDELTPAAHALDVFYRQFRCPNCKERCQKETVSGHAFSEEGSIVPRSCLRCQACKLLFDPHSGLILEGPK